MINDEFIATWVERLRTEIPETVAVILKGSHARGESGPYSDVDFDLLVRGDAREDYLAWIIEHGNRLVHVSVAVNDVATWIADGDEAEPWAFGLPVQETTHLLWACNEALRERLDRPARSHPPGDTELEDFIEAFGKVRNAMYRNDELAMRLAAQTMGGLCPSLLQPLNPETHPSHHYDALVAALEFPVSPENYRDDLLLCLGLTGRANTLQDLLEASRRLAEGVIHLLREHIARASEKKLQPDLYAYLLDGTLERYVAQLASD